MLYVNNIRSYYNIIGWLTENEDDPESEEEAEEEAAPEIIASLLDSPRLEKLF